MNSTLAGYCQPVQKKLDDPFNRGYISITLATEGAAGGQGGGGESESNASTETRSPQGWEMTALEHYEKKVGLTQQAFDRAAAKARLWDYVVDELQALLNDESGDLAYGLHHWLEEARKANARIAAGDFR